MNDKSQVESILNDIKSMVNNVIIKLSYNAEQYETLNIKREADRYIAAYMERDTFNSYRNYSMDVLSRAGITNLNELTEYSNDRHKIPRNKRKDVLKAMRETVINEYVEMDDYYRELIGLPPVNTPESDWIYLTEEEMRFYEIDEIRPIHDYPKEIQYKLERNLIPQLIKLYPERTYLQHIGSKAVNLVRAREAKNFEIIFTDINLDTVFMRAFFDTYDFAREYFMNILYNKNLRDRYDLYDNYIGMHIMIMTVQRLVVDTIKMGIDRDFYDLISIKKLFNVYGLPFFEGLPLDYQRTIVKNVNMLIRSKSTDKVLYDIANTLFYERVKIYKYYLVKQRKFDKNGDPIFLYKERVLDEPLEKYYITSSNDKKYMFTLIDDDKLATVEADVEYAPDSIYMEDTGTGELIKLYMLDERLYSEKVDHDGQIITDVILYNEIGEKYKLVINNNKLKTEFTHFNVITEYDYENMFDVYFQASDILEKNIISSMETKYNRYSYEEVTNDDVYWWETEELKKELYEREYTYIDTKYISITVMQNVTKMLYETSYFLNLLVDHKITDTPLEQRIFNSDTMKIGTDYLYVNLDRITNVPVSIFDTVMILCALISKKNGMKGNIIVESPSKILSVLGFNFELNFDLIRSNIKKYKKVFKNQEILKYLDLLDIRTVKDIDTLFNNFKNFAEFCADVIANTNDINEYKAYKELYKVITVRKDSTELFKLSNGEIATTYLEYLYDKLPLIAEFIDELHKDKTGVYIEHAIGRLNELIPEIEYLNTLNGTNNTIVQAIQGLVNFFKSYTVDLRTLNIMYMFDNKTLNKIYMIDDPRLLINLAANESVVTYNDVLRPFVKFDKQDNLIIYDPERTKVKLNPKEFVEYYNKIQHIKTTMSIDDLINRYYKDILEIYNKMKCTDVINLHEFDKTLITIYLDAEFNTEHKINALKLILSCIDTLEYNYKDIIKENRIIIDKPDFMNLRNVCNKLIGFCLESEFYNSEKLIVEKSFLHNDTLKNDYKDIIRELANNMQIDDRNYFKDLVKITYED
jgi:hypothetical protein